MWHFVMIGSTTEILTYNIKKLIFWRQKFGCLFFKKFHKLNTMKIVISFYTFVSATHTIAYAFNYLTLHADLINNNLKHHHSLVHNQWHSLSGQYQRISRREMHNKPF